MAKIKYGSSSTEARQICDQSACACLPTQTHTGAHLTRGGLADGGVVGTGLEAVHAEAVEAAVGVDAALGAGIGGQALVHVHARLPVPLQLESRMTPALKAARAKEKNRPQKKSQPHSCGGELTLLVSVF